MVYVDLVLLFLPFYNNYKGVATCVRRWLQKKGRRRNVTSSLTLTPKYVRNIQQKSMESKNLFIYNFCQRDFFGGEVKMILRTFPGNS
jgi:hypothetical protein